MFIVVLFSFYQIFYTNLLPVFAHNVIFNASDGLYVTMDCFLLLYLLSLGFFFCSINIRKMQRKRSNETKFERHKFKI